MRRQSVLDAAQRSPAPAARDGRIPARRDERARFKSSKALLAVALAAVVVSGCACETPPGRAPRGCPPPIQAPKMGPEVPLVRIKLGDDMTVLGVAVAGPWRLVGDAGEVASGETLDWTEVTVKDRQVLFGSLPAVAGAVELRSERDAGVWVRQTVGGAVRERGYRGLLRIAPTSAGALRAINILPMEA